MKQNAGRQGDEAAAAAAALRIESYITTAERRGSVQCPLKCRIERDISGTRAQYTNYSEAHIRLIIHDNSV